MSRESSLSDEEDKDSVQEDVPSSPESPAETHTANIRQKAVSLPSDASNSGCEEGEGGGGGGGEGEAAREREGSSQDNSDSGPDSTTSDTK